PDGRDVGRVSPEELGQRRDGFVIGKRMGIATTRRRRNHDQRRASEGDWRIFSVDHETPTLSGPNLCKVVSAAAAWSRARRPEGIQRTALDQRIDAGRLRKRTDRR